MAQASGLREPERQRKPEHASWLKETGLVYFQTKRTGCFRWVVVLPHAATPRATGVDWPRVRANV